MKDKPHKKAGDGTHNKVTFSHRILLVDDDRWICEIIAESLTRTGYDVKAVEDGVLGWQTLLAGHYDLLITDNNMPNMSGVELLKKVRAVGMAVPVIMITGEFPEEEFIRYPWLRPQAVLSKPFSVADILKTVKRVLSEAKEKSAYFESLTQTTAQLDFNSVSAAVKKSTPTSNSDRSSA